ncbi:MAG: hypothetical protein D6744_03410 [Planctomycetota bacterium]|nr:MAG: hypothetical protein D6744_03410 [Planctomycetota bacterium]
MAAVLSSGLLVGVAQASNCEVTSVGFIPLNDLGAGLYLGQFEGGLYGNGQNHPPARQAAEGVARARSIEPLDTNGQPDPNGKYVLLSIGMSNTTQEFCSRGSLPPCDPWTFMGQAAVDPNVNHTTLAIINGARGGQAAEDWESPASPNYNRILTDHLIPAGLSEAQVQVAWVKVANRAPTVGLPNANADAFELMTRMGNIARTLRIRYPNLKLALFSSRIYAGYASTTLNPEPYAYESAFAVQMLIKAQIMQMATGVVDPRAGDLNYDTAAPWIGWAAYLWADGLTPRSDGLIWQCIDLENDGTHPSTSGEEKVGRLLLRFMKSAPWSVAWFRADGGGYPPADLNGDCVVDLTDLALLLNNFGASGAGEIGDVNEDGAVDLTDLAQLLATFDDTCPSSAP